MKTLLSLSLCAFLCAATAQKKEDEQAIKSFCGCYEIQFNFAETFSYPKDSATYQPSKVKHETALEWAELIEDTPGKKSIQHLLIVGRGMIVKHWRQDWTYENTRFYDYNGFNDWKFLTVPAPTVRGQWTQSVFEVDDKPRYTGSATWNHVDGRHFWENLTNAPLPRREYTQREDYNITRRFNTLEITNTGWIHDQDNDKIIKEASGSTYLLAQEKGNNIYKKVDDSKCEAAQKWWKENQAFWKKVRLKWDAVFAKNATIQLKNEVDGKPLHVHLQALSNQATQDEINAVIDRFIISK